MDFEVLGKVREVETIASGTSVQNRKHLSRAYGTGRWKKKKGIAHVRLGDGAIRLAEIHWYEAHGIGQRDHKIKRYLDRD